MVDAPEFSQAHLYRLVNMVAGAGIPSYVRLLTAVDIGTQPEKYLWDRIWPRLRVVLLQNRNAATPPNSDMSPQYSMSLS